MAELCILALAGGVLALDGTSVGQFMLSRPLVAGALAGWLVGDPVGGVWVGAILELYFLVSVPSGGARFPEGATGTVVAVAAMASVEGPGALPLGVAAGLLWGQVGGLTISGLRRLNARIVPVGEGPHPPDPALVERAHLGAVALDFLRGTLVTAVGVLLAVPAVGLVDDAWPWSVADSTGLLLVGGVASVGIFLRSLGGAAARPLLLLTGLVLGLLGGRLL